MPAQYFRAGAGAVIVNSSGLVLALERAANPGAWQMPQGGIERDEEPLDGVLREVFEETGIPSSKLELLDTYPEPLAYELPVEMRSEKTGRGQVQYWYLFRLKEEAAAIELVPGKEFRAWRWVPLTSLPATVIEFRRPLYEHLVRRFGPLLR